MQDQQIGRVLRALRHRRGWRQSDLATVADTARSVLSDLEAGRLDTHALGALRRSIHAAGGLLRLTVDVPGGDLSRLLDVDHARLQARWLEILGRAGWQTVPEATFSVYGERGSIDVLAWHPAVRVLMIVEVKTVIVDAGSLLANLDRKARIGGRLARDRGWVSSAIVPALLVRDGTTARRRLAELAPLFSHLAVRGREALGWLRAPAFPAPTGLLVLAKVPDAHPGDRRRAGRRRIRLGTSAPRSRATDDGSSAGGERA
jgi:transcriptional regulator with XRE-family HTH domain